MIGLAETCFEFEKFTLSSPGETVVCTVLQVVVALTPEMSVCSLNSYMRWYWLINFQIQKHHIFSYNTCKISFYVLINFEVNKVLWLKEFFILLSFFLCFFFLSSYFIKQIVIDILLYVRQSLGEWNSMMNKTHNLPSELSCLRSVRPARRKTQWEGVSHVLQRRESKSFFLIPHKDFS